MPPSLGRFGDARRLSAGTDLLARLVEVGQSGVSVRALGGSRSGEVRFGRFLRCDAVTPGEIDRRRRRPYQGLGGRPPYPRDPRHDGAAR